VSIVYRHSFILTVNFQEIRLCKDLGKKCYQTHLLGMILSDFGIAHSLIPISKVEVECHPFRSGMAAVHLISHQLLRSEFCQEIFHGVLDGTPVTVKVPISYALEVSFLSLYRCPEAKDDSGLRARRTMGIYPRTSQYNSCPWSTYVTAFSTCMILFIKWL
jgi:hypothetical protein